MASKKKFKISYTSGSIENSEAMKNFFVDKFAKEGTLAETHYKFHSDDSVDTTLTFKVNIPNKGQK